MSGGPCARGQFVTNLSSLAELTCGPEGSLTALGKDALKSNTSGTDNTAVGVSALTSNTVGTGNAALGERALGFNTSGGGNSAVGRSALVGNDNGIRNSAVGDLALSSNSSGGFNAAFGAGAGNSLTSGSNNALLGTDAGGSLTNNDSSNIDVGHSGVAGDNNTIRIGTQGTGAGEHNRAFLAGVFGVTSSGGAAVFVNSSGQLGTTTSSRRFKTAIRPLGSMKRLMRLRPVSFLYKSDRRAGRQYGLIAEEVVKVFPNLVVNGKDGRPYTVAYHQLPVLLLAQLQRQQRHINRLERKVRKLARRR